MPARKDPTFCGAFLFYYVDMESYTANSKISTTIFLSIPKKTKTPLFSEKCFRFYKLERTLPYVTVWRWHSDAVIAK